MNTETVTARSAIEALRSGVPSRHAVTELGTTQQKIKDQFETALRAIAKGQGTQPIVLVANFGAGKSHLLTYFQSLAEQQRFVTSYVVISPEMPLGNGHIVLKAIAESARAPGRLGKALRALSTGLSTSSRQFADLRLWARDATIHDRFRALLHIYEEFRVDEELRAQILDDFGGKPLPQTIIKQKLKEIGQAAGYNLRGPRNPLLAHDRIKVFARFCRACNCKGLVVLFDELERVCRFTLRQRVAAWQELGWWREIAEEEGSAILPVFTTTEVLLSFAQQDKQRFLSITLSFDQDERDKLAQRGIEMLEPPYLQLLESPTAQQKEEIKYRIKSLYEQAYGARVTDLPEDARTSIRSEIRRWITHWDLQRYYPEYAPHLEAEEVEFDTSEIPDEALAANDDGDFVE